MDESEADARLQASCDEEQPSRRPYEPNAKEAGDFSEQDRDPTRGLVPGLEGATSSRHVVVVAASGRGILGVRLAVGRSAFNPSEKCRTDLNLFRYYNGETTTPVERT